MRLDDKRFKAQARMTKDAFKQLLNLIKDDPVFDNNSRHKQAPVEDQLMLFVWKLGNYGNGVSFMKLAFAFGISEGTVERYYARCLLAILALESRTVVWPTKEKKQTIKRAIKKKFTFNHCIGFVDGTLLPLYQAPSEHAADYYSRKGFYAISAMVVCDEKKKITYISAGLPGCSHDQRVYNNTELVLQSGNYFEGNEYLISDSGLKSTNTVVSSFKTPPKGRLNAKQEYFNLMIAKARVLNEHCIGILKGRFQSLRQLRFDVGTVRGAQLAIFTLRAATVLHNLLIDDGDEFLLESTLEDEVGGHELDLGINIEGDSTEGNELKRSLIMEHLWALKQCEDMS